MQKILNMLPIPWEQRDIIWKDTESSYQIERVYTQWDYELEGYFLAHCLGTKEAADFNRNHEVFSIRGKEGVPHATILTAYEKEKSPYFQHSDIAAANSKSFDDVPRYILQVRGRYDDLARIEFSRIARRFYRAFGGICTSSDAMLDYMSLKYGDTDVKYHYFFCLDEKKNNFNFSYRFTPPEDESDANG